MPGGGPVTAMRAEHEEIEGELAKVATSRDAGEARQHLEAAIAEARSHFHKEEVVLFPMAEQLLAADLLEEMGAAWAQNRGVALPAATGCRGGFRASRSRRGRCGTRSMRFAALFASYDSVSEDGFARALSLRPIGSLEQWAGLPRRNVKCRMA